MMKLSRRCFLEGTAAFAGCALFGETVEGSPYETADGRATDSVFARRAYIDLAGRVPATVEAQGYVFSSAPDRKARLIDDLLAADSFADYWSMRFCDILRVKSEFPINLWPNAVYVYHRRIRDFVKNDEPWDHFARALLTSTGSDFRDPEANFFRALARRTPEGFAEAVALTFLGQKWNEVPKQERDELMACFENVSIKNTREWKEEIVTIAGEDRRGAFCDRLFGEWKWRFAAAFVRRVDWWLFGREQPDPAHVRLFIDNGYRLKPLVRALALSADYERGPISGGFPCRRLDAEVLDDAICDILGAKRNYQSIAPEPFTFLPRERRSVLIEDGSIANAFLLLFGRPARDTGLLSERHNEVTPKQRLYLFNSGKLYQMLGRLTDSREFHQQTPAQFIANLYWRFFSRAPTDQERKMLLVRHDATRRGRERWNFPKDLAWALMNSREFLYQH